MKKSTEHKFHLLEDTEGLNQYLTLSEINVIIDRISFINKFLDNQNWLDLCCGEAISSLLLKKKNNSKYLGVDFIKENCEKAKKLFGVNVICADVHKLPFKGDKFEIVTLSAAVYYLERSKLITEVYKVLKKDGLFIFDTSNPDLPNFNHARETTNYFTAKDWISFLERSGFSVRCYEGNEKYDYNPIKLTLNYIKKNLKLFLFKIPYFKKKLRNISVKYKSKYYFDEEYLFKNINQNGSWKKLNENDSSKSLVLYFVCKKVS